MTMAGDEEEEKKNDRSSTPPARALSLSALATTPPRRFNLSSPASREASSLEALLQTHTDTILTAVQQEAHRRAAGEERLYRYLVEQQEAMVAMELRLVRLEAKVTAPSPQPMMMPRNQRREGMAVYASTSGASLTSGVSEEEEEGEEVNDTDSTPTFGSRPAPRLFGPLESILLNPVADTPGNLSTRATRSPTHAEDSLASWATRSASTSTTLASTAPTATTRGTESLVPPQPFVRPMDDEAAQTSPLTVPDSSTVEEGLGSQTASVLRSRRSESRVSLDQRVVSFGTAQRWTEEEEEEDDYVSAARAWREEYEARLEALQKRWNNSSN